MTKDRLDKNQPTKSQNYRRLLGYLKPYWFRLTVGILAGLLVGSSLLTSLLFIPKLVGTMESKVDATAIKELKEDMPEEEIADPELKGLLNTAKSYADRFNLPITLRGREVTVEWPYQFSFEIVDGAGRIAWQIFAVYMIGFVLAWTLKNLFTYVNRYFMRWVGNRMVADLRGQAFKKLMDQSLRFYGNSDVGQLISRCTNDTAAIEQSADIIADLTTCPVQVFACLAAIIIACVQYDSYMLVFILLIGTPLVTVPVAILGTKIRHIYRLTFAKIADIVSRMHESFTGIKVVKAYHTEAHEIERFNDTNERYFSDTARVLRLQLLLSPLMEVVAVTATLVFLLFSYSRGVTLTELSALLAPAFMAYQPIKEMSRMVAMWQRSMAAADRYFELIDIDTSLPEKTDAIEMTSFEDKIEFDHVTFAYGDRIVADDICMVIPKGSMVAVVGETGSGKSTLANLLARFYDVDSGSVKIDGVDVRDYQIASLRQHIGVVTQEAILFNDTIANNIAYGCQEATQEDIVTAAKLANAHEFIVGGRHELGYDAEVGEKGFMLSGGEKQRVSIARAILRNPPILILDEATSALDTVTEKLVQEALTRVMQNRTVFAIAHRLSTIKHADVIMVLKNGRIAECGSHDELLKHNGIYCNLYNTQFERDA